MNQDDQGDIHSTGVACGAHPIHTFYGRYDFGMPMKRYPHAVTLCKNVRAWEDPQQKGHWFVEPLPLDVVEVDFSRIPSGPHCTMLYLTEGVVLIQQLHELTWVERI